MGQSYSYSDIKQQVVNEIGVQQASRIESEVQRITQAMNTLKVVITGDNAKVTIKQKASVSNLLQLNKTISEVTAIGVSNDLVNMLKKEQVASGLGAMAVGISKQDTSVINKINFNTVYDVINRSVDEVLAKNKLDLTISGNNAEFNADQFAETLANTIETNLMSKATQLGLTTKTLSDVVDKNSAEGLGFGGIFTIIFIIIIVLAAVGYVAIKYGPLKYLFPSGGKPSSVATPSLAEIMPAMVTAELPLVSVSKKTPGPTALGTPGGIGQFGPVGPDDTAPSAPPVSSTPPGLYPSPEVSLQS
jgi:hypothetical protein